MNPTRNQLLLIATAVVWVIAYAAWTADWMIGSAPLVLERALRRIPMCLFGGASCWGIKVCLDRLGKAGIGLRLSAAAGLCVVACLAYVSLNTVVFYVVAPVWGPTTLGGTLQNAMMIAWVFFAWAALYFAIGAALEADAARVRLADAQNATLRARNQALAQQISPHFLFNSLNTVSGLIIEGEPDRAERVTVALAGLLRRSLETDGRERVPLGEELEAVHRYIEIERNRFEGRLLFEERIALELRGIAIPPLILQPLVENAVKHGVSRSSAPVRLTLAASVAGDELRIVVSDDAAPDVQSEPPPGVGIGQANIGERLSLLYGDRASLRCGPRQGPGYSCEISLPAVPHDPA